MVSFTPRDTKRLLGVNPSLVSVVMRAAEIGPRTFFVVEGVRTKERQQELYDQGRTTPGRIVTWTLQSKHIIQADGFGHAVDLYPILNPGMTIDQIPMQWWGEIAQGMLTAAADLGIPIRWGHDWDMDGIVGEKGETDKPHWELA